MMRRAGGSGSLAVVCGMPCLRTVLRLRPGRPPPPGKRQRALPLRGHAGGAHVFDAVLGEGSTQHQAYECAAAALVESFIQGESGVLLVYGASGSGKTHTLQGTSSSPDGIDDDAGVVPRAVEAVLRGLSVVPRSRYRLRASFCGLGLGHDAQLVDLLAPEAAFPAVSLRDGSAAAALQGLTLWDLRCGGDAWEVLRCRPPQHAAPGGTLKWPRAGGLHTMLTLQLEALDGTGSGGGSTASTYLSFVELAAPAHLKDTLGQGRSGAEHAHARSLAVAYAGLAKVLAALRHSAPLPGPGAAAALAAAGVSLRRVPWRDSPLTRLLQERLHCASAITLLATVSCAPEAAADSVATIGWAGRFSCASRAAGGVRVSFCWDAVADPGTCAGSYLRMQPEAAVVRGQASPPDPDGTLQQDEQQQQQPQAGAWRVPQLAPPLPPAGSLYEPGCSSPMVNVCSPSLPSCSEGGLPTPPSAVPHSTASAVGGGGGTRQLGGWRRPHQPSPESTPVTRLCGEQRQQARRDATAFQSGEGGEGQQQQQQQQQQHAHSAGGGPPPAAPPALEQPLLGLGEEALLYGELLSAVRRGGGGGNLRAEAILERLLQELGAARAALSAKQAESRALGMSLAALQQEHGACESSRRLMQGQAAELHQQLEVAKRGLAEAASDRDLFLRRLQHLELLEGQGDEASAGARLAGSSRLELQRQKAHAAQLRMMEAELSAVAASNQQLRRQLEAAGQQLAGAGRDRLAEQQAAADAAERAQAQLDSLQHEAEVLRSAADVEAALRQELEASVDELQHACEESKERLASAAAQSAELQRQRDEAQEAVDALVGELEDALARAGAAEAHAAAEVRVAALEQHLAAEKQEHELARQQHSAAQQQLSALQVQVGALEETMHSMQQQQQQVLQSAHQREEEAGALTRLLADMRGLLEDFGADLHAALPREWQAVLDDKGSGEPSASQLAADGGGSDGGAEAVEAAAAMPAVWARRLQAVVELLQLAGEQRSRAVGELQASSCRMQLLDSNAEELRKLVDTQEELHRSLASQLEACEAERRAASAQATALQQQVEEAHAAVATMHEQLQESQARAAELEAAGAERDEALGLLADELLGAAAAQEAAAGAQRQAEERAVELASELEEALLQLDVRDQVLDQVWGQLRGLPQPVPGAGGAAGGGAPAPRALPAGPAALERPQQRQGRWQQHRCGGLLSPERVQSGSPPSVGLAQQVLRAAGRRLSASGPQQPGQHQDKLPEQQQEGQRADEASCADQGGGDGGDKAGGSAHGHAAQQQQQQPPMRSDVQPLVVAAVQRLRGQADELQRQLENAEVGGEAVARQRQQLADLRRQHGELADAADSLQRDKQQLQAKCRWLNTQLAEREQQLEQAQERCQELLAAFTVAKRQLGQQRPSLGGSGAGAGQRCSDPAAPATPSLVRARVSQLEVQLAEAYAALSAERAAHLAREEAHADKGALQQRVAALQAEADGLRAQLAAEQGAAEALRRQLGAAVAQLERLEAAAVEAQEAAEGRAMELARARAELLQARQQLAAAGAGPAARQEAPAPAGAAASSGGGGGCGGAGSALAVDGVAAARLAAAQVLRREAEDQVAGLARKLATAERRLAQLEQQAERWASGAPSGGGGAAEPEPEQPQQQQQGGEGGPLHPGRKAPHALSREEVLTGTSSGMQQQEQQKQQQQPQAAGASSHLHEHQGQRLPAPSEQQRIRCSIDGGCGGGGDGVELAAGAVVAEAAAS